MSAGLKRLALNLTQSLEAKRSELIDVVGVSRSNCASALSRNALIKQNTLRVVTVALATIATASFAQDTNGVIDWSELDQSKAQAAATDEPADFKITECPVDLFEDAYGGTIDAANVHAAAALELEVLRVCTKRQDLADQLQKNNRRLREDINIEAIRDEELQAFLAWRNRPETERSAKRPARTTAMTPNPTSGTSPATTPNTPSSSFSNSNFIAEEENARGPEEDIPDKSLPTVPTGEAAIAAQTTLEPLTTRTDNAPLSQVPAPAATHTGCAPEYLVELAGHQRGGDGTFVWATLRSPLGERFVARAGDQLPGGVKIKSVSREVVLVTTGQGATEQLAKAPEAAPEPIDAAFSFTLIKQDQALNSEFILPTLEDQRR